MSHICCEPRVHLQVLNWCDPHELRIRAEEMLCPFCTHVRRVEENVCFFVHRGVCERSARHGRGPLPARAHAAAKP